MKKVWIKPSILKIDIKKITLSGATSGKENTGVGGSNRKD